MIGSLSKPCPSCSAPMEADSEGMPGEPGDPIWNCTKCSMIATRDPHVLDYDCYACGCHVTQGRVCSTCAAQQIPQAKPRLMKVLVITGSRRGTSKTDVLKQLIRGVDLVLTGGAPGVDSQAKRIAAELGIHTASVDALWSKYHNGAGPKRNDKLAEVAAVWLGGGAEVHFGAFPWPGSTESGTHDCVGKLLAVGIAGDVY